MVEILCRYQRLDGIMRECSFVFRINKKSSQVVLHGFKERRSNLAVDSLSGNRMEMAASVIMATQRGWQGDRFVRAGDCIFRIAADAPLAHREGLSPLDD